MTANCVSLGATRTPTTAALDELDEAQSRRRLSSYAVKRFGEPEDASAAICFLASEEASWITTQTLPVNGGTRVLFEARSPLAGVRVLSVAQRLPGPYATKLLRELGAEVVSVEPPGGDPSRQNRSLFDLLNHGGSHLRLDLKSPPDHQQFMDLASSCRIFLEGYRPGVAQRLESTGPV